MKPSILRHLLAGAALSALALAGCTAGSSGSSTSYVNALSGATCTPGDTYTPAPPPGNGQANGHGSSHCQGTGPGDNCDDLHSGKVDCIGDGNSGQGDDKKHNCQFPQPGCDEQGCCDDDMVEDPPPPPGDDDPPPPPGDDDPSPPDIG
jgi:hypothetical protein